MKTYDEIRSDLFRSIPFPQSHSDLINVKAAKIYAQQVAEDVRQRCCRNATITENWHGGEPVAWVDDKSILNTEIILP
jgi:hypothetical protein